MKGGQSFYTMVLGVKLLCKLQTLLPSKLVSCPACMRLLAKNGIVNKVKFPGLIPQTW